MERINNSKGFIILFTVLISTIVLLIAIGISNLSLKQIQLSASAREGHYAFYAADAGIECALFQDSQGTFSDPLQIQPFTCADEPVSAAYNTADNRFEFEFPLFDGAACVNMLVYKQYPVPSGGTETRMESFGTNTPCDDDSLKTVERAVRVTYPDGSGGGSGLQTCIYRENESSVTTTQSSSVVVLDETTDPYNGTFHIRIHHVPDIQQQEVLTGVLDSALDRADVNSLRLFTKLNGDSSSGAAVLTLELKNAGQSVASISLLDNEYGFDVYNNTYHSVVVPLDDFSWLNNGTQWDTLVLTGTDWIDLPDTSRDFDDICFQV